MVARCNKLDIESIQGKEDKLTILKFWTDKHGIDLKSIVYLGNDINDLSCIRSAGCGIVVNDAHADALASADMVL